jgi:hypothetical protein
MKVLMGQKKVGVLGPLQEEVVLKEWILSLSLEVSWEELPPAWEKVETKLVLSLSQTLHRSCKRFRFQTDQWQIWK